MKKKIFSKNRSNHIARGGDDNYGDHPLLPDLDKEAMAINTEIFLSSLAVNSRDELEGVTRGQASNPRWMIERTKRVSSFFKDVVERRPTTLCMNLVRRVIYLQEVRARAIVHGRTHERNAIEAHKKIQNVSVEECGLFIDQVNLHLCASPGGSIGLNGLLETKCPYSAESAETFEEVCRKK